jgi:hypothetical protein
MAAQGRPRAWIGLWLLNTLLLYTHFLGWAVVGLQVDCQVLGGAGGMLMACATGTAVQLEPVAPPPPPPPPPVKQR